MIAIVDYGMGNRRSVEKALEHVGARPGSRPATTRSAPRTGSCCPGSARSRRRCGGSARWGWTTCCASGSPPASRCSGSAWACSCCSSAPPSTRGRGLGILSGEVTALRAPRLPHIGWNLVTLERPAALTEGLGPATAFYHVHSFACRPADPADVVGVAEYGERFASIVERGTVSGVQFHPEKSSRDGLALLRNFTAVCARVAA